MDVFVFTVFSFITVFLVVKTHVVKSKTHFSKPSKPKEVVYYPVEIFFFISSLASSVFNDPNVFY